MRIKLLVDRDPRKSGDVFEASRGLSTYLLSKGRAVEAEGEKLKPVKPRKTKK